MHLDNAKIHKFISMTPAEAKLLGEITATLENLTVDQLDALSKKLNWGTFGRSGTEPLVFKTLCELDTDHIENIIITQGHTISPIYAKVMLFMLKNRYTQGVTAAA